MKIGYPYSSQQVLSNRNQGEPLIRQHKDIEHFTAVPARLCASRVGRSFVSRSGAVSNHSEGVRVHTGSFPQCLGEADHWIFVYVCTDIPLSVGILDPRASPTQLNAVEFLWDPAKRASAFIQVCKHESFGGRPAS